MGTNGFPKTEQGPHGDRVPKLIPMWLAGPPRLGNVDLDKINILQCEDIFLPAHTCRGWQRQLHSNSPTKTSWLLESSRSVSYLQVLAGDRHDSLWPWSIWDPGKGFWEICFCPLTQLREPDSCIVVWSKLLNVATLLANDSASHLGWDQQTCFKLVSATKSLGK